MSILNAMCTNADCTFVIPQRYSSGEDVPEFCAKCGTQLIDACPKCKEPIRNAESLPTSCDNCGEELRHSANSRRLEETLFAVPS
jgi:hypothetical protein